MNEARVTSKDMNCNAWLAWLNVFGSSLYSDGHSSYSCSCNIVCVFWSLKCHCRRLRSAFADRQYLCWCFKCYLNSLCLLTVTIQHSRNMCLCALQTTWLVDWQREWIFATKFRSYTLQ